MKREYLCVNYPLQCVIIEGPVYLILVKQGIIVLTIMMTAMTCVSMEGHVYRVSVCVLHTMVVYTVRYHTTQWPHCTRLHLPAINTPASMECVSLPVMVQGILASVILGTQVRTVD